MEQEKKKELRQTKRDKSNTERKREREGIFGKTRYGTLLYYFSTQPPTMAIKRIKKRKKHFNPSLSFCLAGRRPKRLPGRRPFPMSKKLSDNCYKRRRKEKKKDPPFSLSLSAIPPTAFWGLETGPDEG
jgi:hypothetical protein